jgi:peptide/nickel transport system permease protein
MSDLLKALRGDGMGLAGLVLLAAIALVALLAPLIAPGDPFRMDWTPFLPPGGEHLLGTDNIGRDVFALMVHGTKVSLLFAFGAAGVSLLLGMGLGGIAGYYGGIIDDVISRLSDAFLIIPRLFLIIVIVAMFGSQLWMVVFIIGVTLWPANARIMRAQVLSLRGRGFVQAARVAGGGDAAIIFGQIAPNSLGPVLANSVLQMAYAVLTEASLAFLGLGDPNVPSWGQILYAGQNYLSSAPWLMIFPGLALAVLLLALHMVGNALVEALNPKLRRTRRVVLPPAPAARPAEGDK